MKRENIHPTAIIYENVKLHKNVKIGAYSIIYPNVEYFNWTILHNWRTNSIFL